MSNIALILAGGTGSRMGADIPKQFLPLANGKTIVISSIDAFANHPLIEKILVICHKDYINILSDMISIQEYKKPVSITAGGETRRHSSFIGLKTLSNECIGDDIVLIHDAARPFVDSDIITRNIECAKRSGACTTAIPMQDTAFISEDGTFVSSLINRSKMHAIQTPQTFCLSLILTAHKQSENSTDFTDDAGLLFSQNIPVSLVMGSKKNLKITSAEDIKIANCFLT